MRPYSVFLFVFICIFSRPLEGLEPTLFLSRGLMGSGAQGHSRSSCRLWFGTGQITVSTLPPTSGIFTFTKADRVRVQNPRFWFFWNLVLFGANFQDRAKPYVSRPIFQKSSHLGKYWKRPTFSRFLKSSRKLSRRRLFNKRRTWEITENSSPFRVSLNFRGNSREGVFSKSSKLERLPKTPHSFSVIEIFAEMLLRRYRRNFSSFLKLAEVFELLWNLKERPRWEDRNTLTV